jgi:hypothetical protein
MKSKNKWFLAALTSVTSFIAIEGQTTIANTLTDQEKALQLDHAVYSITINTQLTDIESLYQSYLNSTAQVKQYVRTAAILENMLKERRLQHAKDIQDAQINAQKVMLKIGQLTSYSSNITIRNVRSSYEQLSSLAKSYVTNIAHLQYVEAVHNSNAVQEALRLEAQKFDQHMKQLQAEASYQKVQNARTYYTSLSNATRAYVTTLPILSELERLWSQQDYRELHDDYYPHYLKEQIHNGIEVVEPKYDPLYIPDVNEENVMQQTGIKTYSQKYTFNQLQAYDGKVLTYYVTNDILIELPLEELKRLRNTISIQTVVGNRSISVMITESNRPVAFKDFVKITVPTTLFNLATDEMISRVVNGNVTRASLYKLEESKTLLFTKHPATFKPKVAKSAVNDLSQITFNQRTIIRTLEQHAILAGQVGNRYLPNTIIKRRDVAMMVANAFDSTSNATISYTDIQSTPLISAVQTLHERSIMKGKTLTQFAPLDNVTKQEAVVILANLLTALNVELPKNYYTFIYSDTAYLTNEVKSSITLLQAYSILNGTGKFNPTEPLTRAQFAELLYKTLQVANLLN